MDKYSMDTANFFKPPQKFYHKQNAGSQKMRFPRECINYNHAATDYKDITTLTKVFQKGTDRTSRLST